MRQPRPPKAWAARVVDQSPYPRISGTRSEGIIVHPDEFRRLLALGVIDRHGRYDGRYLDQTDRS